MANSGIRTPNLAPANVVSEFVVNTSVDGQSRTTRVAVDKVAVQLASTLPISALGDARNLYPNFASLPSASTQDLRFSAVVYDDPDGNNNGTWTVQLVSSVKTWVFAFPLSVGDVIRAYDNGEGTANAIVATTMVPVSETALIVMNVWEDNTASPVTVSFNGGTALTIKSNSGEDVEVGGLAEGMLLTGYISGSTFRLANDETIAARIYAARDVTTAARDLARDYAEKETDSPVVGGEYSAKHHATKAAASAATSLSGAAQAAIHEAAAEQHAQDAFSNATNLPIAPLELARQGKNNSQALTPFTGRKAFADAFSRPIPRTFFGMHFQSAFTGASPQTPYHDLGQGAVRLWDSGVRWIQLEATKGNFSWTRMDELVALAEANDEEILYCLGQPPVWATGGAVGGGSISGYNNAPPSSDQDWIDYITAVATRYLGRIKAYEVWNEPNLLGFYSGTVARLAELTSLAYDTIKAIDPTAIVVSPSVTGDTGSSAGNSYLRSFLNEGIADKFDAVGIHLYVFPGQPESIFDTMRAYRAVMEEFGIQDREVWNTEFTYHNHRDQYGTQFESTFTSTEAERMPFDVAAGNLVRLMVCSLMAGCSRSYFYGMDHWWSSIRLVDLSNRSTLLPAAKAYQALADFLVGCYPVSFAANRDGTFQAIFVDDYDNRRSIVWAPDYAPREFVPSARGVCAVYLAGTSGEYTSRKEPRRDESLRLDTVPLFALHTSKNAPRSSEAAYNRDPVRFTVTQNSRFRNRVGVTPNGWTTAGGPPTIAMCTEADRPSDDTITFTPTQQFSQLRQMLNRPLEAGTWRVWIDYKLADATEAYYLIMEAFEGVGGPIWGGLGDLRQTEGFVRYEREIVVPDSSYDLGVKLTLAFGEASGFVPIHISGFGVDKVDERPQQDEPYTRRVVYAASASDLVAGNFVPDDVIIFNSAAALRGSGHLGRVCTTAGTLGSVSGVTANISSSSRDITVNSNNALKVGQNITFNGGSRKRIVRQTSPTTYRLNENAGVTASAAIVAFAAPAFDDIGFTPRSDGIGIGVRDRLDVAGPLSDITLSKISGSNRLRRFVLRCNNNAETGSNAGSNFELATCDDAGNFLATVIDIVRSSGLVTFNTEIRVPNNRIQWAGTWDKPLWSINGNRAIWTSTSDLWYKNGAPSAANDGQVISRNLIGIFTGVDAPSLAAGASSSISTVTITGAELGDFVKASMNIDMQGVSIIAWVSAADTVKYLFRNNTGGTIDLGSGTLYLRVEKRIGGG